MDMDLPSDVNEFVKHLVVSGRFQSESEAVAEGVRLLMSHEKLRADVHQGFQQLDEGQAVDGDAVFEELDHLIDSVENEQQGC